MTDLEKRAEEYICEFWFDTSTSVTKSTVKELLIEFTQSETELVSRHLIEMQKTNGALTDRVKELEAQIEKMKCCFNCKHSRTDYEHCITNKHEKWEIKENE